MATGEIRYPDDAANTGKREATRTFTEDGVTKHLPRVMLQDNRVRTGVYYIHGGPLTVLATAHVAPAGFLWLINNTGSTSLIAVRRIRFTAQHSTALATVTAPRIVVERVTFTGTPTGTTIAAAKRRASDVTPANWSMRSTNAGLTLASVAQVVAFYPVMAMTAVGTATPLVDEWEPITSDDMLILGAGEGLRVYQPENGTTADTRRFHLDFIVDEFTEF